MKHAPPPKPEEPAPLFRRQAVAHQARSLEGEVMLSLSFRNRTLIALAALVIIGIVVFAANANYSRVENVPGWVVPEGGLIRVTARQGGTIDELSVQEGDEVVNGQSLATLRLSADTAMGDSGAAIATYLLAELDAARAQAEAEREKLLSEQRSLETQRSDMSRELDASRARIATMSERLNLIEANTARVRTVAERGYASPKTLDEAELNELIARQELVDVQTSVMSMERAIKDIDAQLQALPLSLRAVEAQARANEAALARQSTELSILNGYRAGATVSGRVVAVPVTKGQTVPPQSVIAVITPEGSSLQAELYVPSRSAGFIKEGQEVRLMYQAFPYQKFGTAAGIVNSVSRTVLSPQEVAIPGLLVEEPVFRVKVTMTSDSVQAYGQMIPVQPGMLLNASIIVDRRSLIEWLLDPIYAVGRLG